MAFQKIDGPSIAYLTAIKSAVNVHAESGKDEMLVDMRDDEGNHVVITIRRQAAKDLSDLLQRALSPS